MTDEESFLYDAETELRRARRTEADAARKARDFGQAYIGERTDHDAAEPCDGADALAYDVEAEATRIMEEEKKRRTENFWKGTADHALKGR